MMEKLFYKDFSFKKASRPYTAALIFYANLKPTGYLLASEEIIRFLRKVRSRGNGLEYRRKSCFSSVRIQICYVVNYSNRFCSPHEFHRSQ